MKRLILLVILIVSLASCRDPSDWYPDGTVELSGHYELVSAGTKTLYATVRISNTGGSVISRSTFGLKATTNTRCYHNTVVSEIRILPGTAIWTTLGLPYSSSTESLLVDGLSVGNDFYE